MFVEVATTQKNVKLYKDGAANRLSSSLSPLFYESIPGSGDYDTLIDMTAKLNASGKSYSIVANGWHFKIWHKDQGPALAGTIGYGGRKGKHWIYMRVGGLAAFDSSDQSTHTIHDAAKPPVYNEADFYIQDESRSIGPLNETVRSSSTIGWNNIWNGVDLRIKNTGDGLKMEVVASPSARAWLENKIANASINLATTIVGPKLDCDFSDIPRVKNGAGRKDWTIPFDDSDRKGLRLEDSLNNLLAFMPTDIAYVENDLNGDRISAKVRSLDPELYTRVLTKRLWKTGDKYTIIAGLPAGDFSILADGELVFDPTFNQTVATAENGDSDGSTWYEGGQFGAIFGFSGQDGGFRFTGLSAGGVSQGETFTIATLKLTRSSADSTVVYNLFGDDADTSAAFSSSNRPDQRTATTATVVAGTAEMGSNAEFTFDITTIAEEVIGRGSWADNLTFVWIYQSGGGELGLTNDAAILDLDWPDAAGGAVSSLAGSGGLAYRGGIAGIGGGLAG